MTHTLRTNDMGVIRFTKMQGLGNDYIYVNVMECPISNPEQFSIRWSDRRKGIGSDGLIMIGKSAIADFSMRIFNADGSEARMCGNGARCVGKYLHDKGLTDKTEIRLETLSGIKILKLHLAKDGTVDTVTVNMGQGLPLKVNRGSGTLVGETLNVGEGPTVCSAIDMGNPHLVMFVKDAEKSRVSEVGPFMERLWNTTVCSRTVPTLSLRRFWTVNIYVCVYGSAAAALRLPAVRVHALRRWHRPCRDILMLTVVM